jgi:hypothetical protein
MFANVHCMYLGSRHARYLKQDERPADLHMAQPNVPVSKTGHIPPAKLVHGGRGMQGDHTLATIGKLVVSI